MKNYPNDMDELVLQFDIARMFLAEEEEEEASIVVSLKDITERKRAEEQIRRRNIELAAVNRIGQAFSRLRPPSEIVELLYTHIGQVLDNRNLYIALCDEAHQTLSFPVYTMNGERHTPASRPFGNGLTEYVIRTGAPLLIPRNQPAFLAEQGIDLIGTPSKCFLAAPMRVGERVTGVIAVQDYENEDIYDANHLELIDTLAAQAAIALENARLYSAVRQELDERKRAEEQLAASEAELRALFAGMTDVVIVYDTDGRYIKIAPTNPANLYRPPDDMLGKTVHDILPKEQADYIVAKIGEAIQTGQVVTGEYALQIGGKEIWFASSASRLSENTAVWVAHDITNRKQAEEALQRQLKELNVLHAAALAGVQSTSVDELIERVTQIIG
ncbi:MAG: PAS domain S-box protein, partial [Chloroflexota bacterium]